MFYFRNLLFIVNAQVHIKLSSIIFEDLFYRTEKSNNNFLIIDLGFSYTDKYKTYRMVLFYLFFRSDVYKTFQIYAKSFFKSNKGIPIYPLIVTAYLNN